jgi:membrane protein YqaA with SNARE-associated domain
MLRYFNLYFHYLRRTGLFHFLASNLLKLLLAIAILIGALFLMESYVISIKEIFSLLVLNVSTGLVFAIFVISESLLGLLPPDLFILWSKELSNQLQWNPWWLLGVLALLSYIGGMISYFLGMKIIHIPSIHNWSFKKYGTLFTNLKKWGGFFVVVSALLPVPFAVVMLICGATQYPVRWAAVLALFRFVRFFGYALFLFELV